MAEMPGGNGSSSGGNGRAVIRRLIASVLPPLIISGRGRRGWTIYIGTPSPSPMVVETASALVRGEVSTMLVMTVVRAAGGRRLQNSAVGRRSARAMPMMTGILRM
jgi:hypothetical protein